MKLEEYTHVTLLNETRCMRERHDREHWFRQHTAAMQSPRDGYERAFVEGLRSLAHYAASYEVEFGAKLATDAVLGEAFAMQLRGLVLLLNGNHGRLDAGIFDSSCRALWTLAGFEEEL